ncbi:MAG: ABC transporter ATP-binding protein [Emcibacteraceae bacterium]|nr:ABC transporter ATP-binding protein [Emcibacteraceae bacterium]
MIRLNNISKNYSLKDGEVPALDDINLTIEKGEKVCILGRSGSGKTTLLDIIATILTPSQGSYFYNDMDISQFSKQELAKFRNKEFGFVFQSYYLIKEKNILENICLPAIYSDSLIDPQQNALKLMDILDIAELKDRYPNELSGGQRQRVAIARSALLNPNVIIADEPTGNLDEASSRIVLDHLMNFNEQGKTLILVTHDQEIASHFERKIFLNDGRKISNG